MARAHLPVLVLASILSACSKSKPPPPPGLTFELGFEDTCEPSVGPELAREVPAAGISFDSGLEGRAARFDGSGAELKFRGLDALHVADAMTLEFFAKPADWTNPYAAGSGLESLISHSDIFTIAVDPRSWKLSARITTNESADAQRLEGGTMRPGAWHHVAMVLDPAQGKARLVLDGEVVDEKVARGSVAIRSNLDLVIGTWFKKNQAYCGELDSIRIWSRALSADEIRAHAALVRDGGRSES